MTSRSEGHQRAKPFLRWAGSKRKQLYRLAPFWQPRHRRYVEPFAGSACLFFELAPGEAILGDNNAELIEVYKVIRDNHDRLYKRLSHIPRDAATYYRWRDKSPEKLDLETRVLRFVFLNRNCFNGIFRTNVKGEFNVPFGRRPGAYFSKSDLALCAELLKRATLLHGDFEQTIAEVKQDDFVYLDPPYAVESRRVFRQYGSNSFRTSDIQRLSEALDAVRARSADFVVSYADCPEAVALSESWNSICLPIRRHVAGFADARRHAYEWIITNMDIPNELLSGRSR